MSLNHLQFNNINPLFFSTNNNFFRPVFDEVSRELGVEDKNPFEEEDEDDDYDSSGKNPFAE